MKGNMHSWWGMSKFSCVSSTIRKLIALFFVLCSIFSAQSVLADDPGAASDNGVQPIFYNSNLTCSQLLPEFNGDLVEYKLEPVVSGVFGDGTLNVDIQTFSDQTFDWDIGSSKVIIQGIFVKGGPDGNLYVYGDLTKSDGGLHSPLRNPSKYYGLSHISFCYTPGLPEITITKICKDAGLNENGNAFMYDYEITVENTGSVPLFNVDAQDDTALEYEPFGDHKFNWATLAIGEKTDPVGGRFTLNEGENATGFENEASVKAATENGGAQAVIDDVTVDCPDQNTDGALEVTKICNVVVENLYDAYGLRVNYKGQVCNTSDVALINVEVQDDKDPTVHNIGTLAPAGMTGACADYGGSYVPVPQEGENLPSPGFDVTAFKDVATARGQTVFGVTIKSEDITDGKASCYLCPQCADLDICPVEPEPELSSLFQ